ncbi:PKD domain-containing protein [Pseudoscardovia radai]|uniref:PKD domain-containing protein n=1 Tax=Pseudoscardovia radai TaxID=987066 RepID=UPI0039931485
MVDRKSTVMRSGLRRGIALFVAAASFLSLGVNGAYAGQGGITSVSDALVSDATYRVPAVESTIGLGAIPVGAEGPVSVRTADGAASALVRISVFGAAEDTDVTMGGAAVLHVAAGHDASTTVLAPVKDGAVTMAATGQVDARVEVLASFGSDTTTPGSTVALESPVTRADNASGLAASALTVQKQTVGLLGRGGVPVEGIRAAYVTADISLDGAGTVTFAGQQLRLDAGRTVVSTLVTTDDKGNVEVCTDGVSGALRLDVRGYVVGSGQNLESANVQGGFVPVAGSAAESAVIEDGGVASVDVGQRTKGVSFGIGLVDADGNDSRGYLDAGEEQLGRSHGAVLDATNGAQPQLDVIEGTEGTVPVSLRGTDATADLLLIGDVLAQAPTEKGSVSISIDTPAEGQTIDLGQKPLYTASGTVTSDHAIKSVEVTGDGGATGTAAVSYDATGTRWSFDFSLPESGSTTLTFTATTVNGDTASKSVTVNAALPDDDETVLNPRTHEIASGDSSPVIEVADDSVMLSAAPDFQVGNLIVTGFSEGAPDGFIRWVDAIDENNGTWVVSTHEATVGDAFYQVSKVTADPSQSRVTEVEGASDATIVEGQGDAAGSTATTDGAMSDDAEDGADASSDVSANILSSDTGAATVSDRIMTQDGSFVANPAVDTTGSSGDAYAVRNVSSGNDSIKSSDWVDANSQDVTLSQSFSKSVTVYFAKGEKKFQVSDSKLSHKVSGTFGFTTGFTTSMGCVFGLIVRPQRKAFFVTPHLEYFRIGTEKDTSTTTKLNLSGTYTASVPLATIENKYVFDAIIPICITYKVSASVDLSGTFELSATTKSSSKQQSGYIFDDRNGIDTSYSNQKEPSSDDSSSEESDRCAKSADENVSISVDVCLKGEIKGLLYDAAGFTCTAKVGKTIEKTKTDKSGGKGEITLSLIPYVSLGVVFNLQIPIVDMPLYDVKIAEYKVQGKASAKLLSYTTCSITSGDGSAGSSGSSSSDSSPSDVADGHDGMTSVTWYGDRTSTGSTTWEKPGTTLEVSPSLVQGKIASGGGSASVSGMSGVIVQTRYVTYAVKNGNSFQIPDEAISVTAYSGDSGVVTVGDKSNDLVFVIDTTGSMSGEISGVKTDIESLVDSISSTTSDYRIAIVEYKDDCDAYQSRVDVDFTNDVSALKSGLDGMWADGGGDTPESMYSGIKTGVDLDWRAGSTKSIILIGDAPGKDPEPVTGYTFDTVVDAATAKNIQIYPMGRVWNYSDSDSIPTSTVAFSGETGSVGTDNTTGALRPLSAGALSSSGPSVTAMIAERSALAAYATHGGADGRTDVSAPAADGLSIATAISDPGDSFRDFTDRIARQTGGVFIEYKSEDFVNRLESAVTFATTRPDVDTNLRGTPHTGESVTFNATATLHADGDPVASYIWDFGDGTDSVTTTTDTASHTYAAAGNYDVIVRVRTASGIEGSGTLPVAVTDRQSPTVYKAHKVVSKAAAGAGSVELNFPIDEGTDSYSTATFANGSDTLDVAGEGTWSIRRDSDGLMLATFTPDPNFSGSQTTHVPYTVYNTGGDSNTSEMWVRYVD